MFISTGDILYNKQIMKITALMERIFRGFSPPARIGLPQDIILELTNTCNLRCVMCHIHSEHVTKKRPEGFMREDLWRKIIDEISTWPHQVNLNTFGGGEALLHPEIADIVKYAKEKPNIIAGFLTNGMLLSREKTAGLLEAGIDWIAVSLDGTDADVVESFRKGSRLATIEENIHNLIYARGESKKPSIRLNMVLLPDVRPQLENFIRKWVPLVDQVMISKYRPLGERTFLDSPLPRRPCYLLEKMLVVAWNGDVGLCCEDNFIEQKMGNVSNVSLEAIWYGKEFQRVRNLHQQGLYHRIGLCKECDTWSSNSVIAEYVNEDGFMVREFTNQKVFSIT
jgi:radical SAM protein with 4Fe4S-binding SPASM domain